MTTDKPSDRTWGGRFIAVRILRVTNTLTVNLCPDRVMPKRRNENTLEFYHITIWLIRGHQTFLNWACLLRQAKWPCQPRLQKQQRRKRSEIQWLGPSGCCSRFSFEDEGETSIGQVECKIEARPMTKKNHKRYFLRNGELRTESVRFEIENAVPGVGNGQGQSTSVTYKTLSDSR
jgi:hypothetical protein